MYILIFTGVRRKLIAAFAAVVFLLISGSCTASTDWQYTVLPGDNLIQIGRRYLQDPTQWPRIQKGNQIVNPYRLRAGMALTIPVALLRYRPTTARMEAINGKVRWRVSNSSAWQTATNGQNVSSESEIETGSDSSVLLRLADKTELVFSANSRIEVGSLSQFVGAPMIDAAVKLQRGLATIRANPEHRSNQKLQILTPSAQAVVRGTEFRVAYLEGVMREETLSGLVEVGNADSKVEVSTRHGTLTRPGEAPMPPVGLLEAPNISAFATKFEQLPLQFALPQLTGAISWQAEISRDSRFQQILFETAAVGSNLILPELPDGDYVLRLRGADSLGIQGLDALHKFTVDARPEAPALQAPGQASVVRFSQPVLRWGSVANAVTYHVQVARDSNFTSLLYDVRTEHPQWEPVSPLDNGTYYWRVASVSTQKTGAWSLWATFVYKNGPGPVSPHLIEPRVESDGLVIELPSPPAGLIYQAMLSPSVLLMPIVESQLSSGGAIKFTRPASGRWFLAVRLLDPSDDVPGYSAVRSVLIP